MTTTIRVTRRDTASYKVIAYTVQKDKDGNIIKGPKAALDNRGDEVEFTLWDGQSVAVEEVKPIDPDAKPD